MDRLLSGRRVLVVEDEMLVLIMIEDMLADLGCKSVTSGATVEKAVSLINAQVFDVAILDMNLNRNDSHAVADALAARGIPFVYSTGNTRHGSRDGYSDRPVLKKPFKYEELVAILTRLTSNWHRSSDHIVCGSGASLCGRVPDKLCCAQP